MIYSPNFALFWGKHLISPFLVGTTLPNFGEIFNLFQVCLKKVDGAIAMSFRKTRVIRREDKRIYELNDKIRSMKNNSDEMSQNEVKKAEEALAQIEHDNINS